MERKLCRDQNNSDAEDETELDDLLEDVTEDEYDELSLLFYNENY